MGIVSVNVKSEFEKEHASFVKDHLRRRTGKRAAWLKERHGHGERMFLKQIWWPCFGHFGDLHPEYEIKDYKDGFRYIDFAYICPGIKLAIEIDGYGPHWRDVSREGFIDHNRRQNDLLMDGWQLLRFSYDDVQDSPRYCQKTLQQFIGLKRGEERYFTRIKADFREREALRVFMKANNGQVTPGDFVVHFGIDPKTARTWLRQLMVKKWIIPSSGTERIRSYKLNLDIKEFRL